MQIVICGLSITSSWGNGHASTYRGLIRELVSRGNDVLFLERDVPWYAANRDMPQPPFGRTKLYSSLDELRDLYTPVIREADLVIVGSYVPQGVGVGNWVLENASNLTAFYDIDTPVTLAKLRRNDAEYISPDQIPRYGMYLSFTGGPTLHRLENKHGARCARALYCCVDPEEYRPVHQKPMYQLGYLGTYSPDRQPALEELLLQPAWRWQKGTFAVAGSQYPVSMHWPPNVLHIEHVPAARHAQFYAQQQFTLNITRQDMRQAGYCPSVRLFEAAACGTPIISDNWEGLGLFFEIGKEIILASSAEEVLGVLQTTTAAGRLDIAARARLRVLREHTAAHRAEQLEKYAIEAMDNLHARRQLAS
jgi:spore maturation protein CgeB